VRAVPGIKCTFVPSAGGSQPSSGRPEGEGGSGDDADMPDAGAFDGNLVTGFDGQSPTDVTHRSRCIT
jgi:hypothetical protein